MLVGTHLLIGENVYSYIQRKLRVELNKTNFLYGNVKPDIVFRLSSKSHRIKDSLEFVLQEIDRLMTLKDISIPQFSVDLGVISHFMSDFFCSAHCYDSEEVKGIVKHLYYEFNLHYQFKKTLRDMSSHIFEKEIDELKNRTISEAITLLRTFYSQKIFCVKNDIYYALKASTLITRNIIENSLLYSKPQIAA